MWSTKKTNITDLQFSSRGEAFAYMLKWQLEEKKADPMEAAEKANQFADIFAANTGVPGKVEPELKGIDKYMQLADKVVCYCDEHPKVVDYVTGVATFLVGLVLGKKEEQQQQIPPQVKEPINFENVE